MVLVSGDRVKIIQAEKNSFCGFFQRVLQKIAGVSGCFPKIKSEEGLNVGAASGVFPNGL